MYVLHPLYVGTPQAERLDLVGSSRSAEQLLSGLGLGPYCVGYLLQDPYIRPRIQGEERRMVRSRNKSAIAAFMNRAGAGISGATGGAG